MFKSNMDAENTHVGKVAPKYRTGLRVNFLRQRHQPSRDPKRSSSMLVLMGISLRTTEVQVQLLPPSVDLGRLQCRHWSFSTQLEALLNSLTQSRNPVRDPESSKQVCRRFMSDIRRRLAEQTKLTSHMPMQPNSAARSEAYTV